MLNVIQQLFEKGFAISLILYRFIKAVLRFISRIILFYGAFNVLHVCLGVLTLLYLLWELGYTKLVIDVLVASLGALILLYICRII